MNNNKLKIVKQNEIQKRIYTIRNLQVMLDGDLAELYGVETKVLNQAAKRNIERFPKEFKFQLTKEEFESLRSQIVTSKTKHGKHYISAKNLSITFLHISIFFKLCSFSC